MPTDSDWCLSVCKVACKIDFVTRRLGIEWDGSSVKFIFVPRANEDLEFSMNLHVFA